VELGEPLGVAVAREVLEETGLIVEVIAQVEVFEHISKDEEGRVSYHYVLVDYLCRERGGRLEAGTDAAEVARVDPSDLARYNVTAQARTVIGRACALAARMAG
jgi:ADP-ribose pyrophosphatase YjhB (NUDIX family)